MYDAHVLSWGRTILKKIIFLFFFAFIHNALSAELRERTLSLRAAGMGGVYSVTAKGFDALYFNPAALGLDGRIGIEVLNMGGGVNGLDAYNQIQSINANPNAGVNAYMGSSYWLGFDARVSFISPRVAFGANDNFDLSLQLHDPVLPKLQTNYLNDMSYYLGTSIPLAKNTYFGLNLIQMNRTGGNQDISAATLTNQAALQNLASQFQNTGQGYGADLAFIYRTDGVLQHTFTGVWENVGGTAFRATGSSGTAPPYIVGNQIMGYSIGQDLPGLDWVWAFEYRFINNNDEELAKKLHMGVELSLPFIDLRYGLNQGYNTYGIGFDALIAKFDLAYYDLEMGSYVGQTQQNRIAASMTFSLSFDANFNFTTSDYRQRRHLKQRR